MKIVFSSSYCFLFFPLIKGKKKNHPKIRLLGLTVCSGPEVDIYAARRKEVWGFVGSAVIRGALWGIIEMFSMQNTLIYTSQIFILIPDSGCLLYFFP